MCLTLIPMMRHVPGVSGMTEAPLRLDNLLLYLLLADVGQVTSPQQLVTSSKYGTLGNLH